jgi:hypothetical protein
VLGHGIDRNLSYEKLDIFKWQQGYCATLELIQNDTAKMLAMITHMKFIFQLAQFYGLESSKYGNGTILSDLEDGKYT